MAEYEQSRRYCKVWWEALKRFNLRPTDGLLMTLIYELSRTRGYCYASCSRLGGYLNISRQSVYSAMDRLVEKGALVVEHTGDFKRRVMWPTDEWKSLMNELGKPAFPIET